MSKPTNSFLMAALYPENCATKDHDATAAPDELDLNEMKIVKNCRGEDDDDDDDDEDLPNKNNVCVVNNNNSNNDCGDVSSDGVSKSENVSLSTRLSTTINSDQQHGSSSFSGSNHRAVTSLLDSGSSNYGGGADSDNENMTSSGQTTIEYGVENQSSGDHNNGMIAKKTSNKVSKCGGSKKVRSAAQRQPRKSLVAMYQSQISGDKNTIKIRIKKSNLTAHVQLASNKKKSGRRKRHKATSDTDISDYEQHQGAIKKNKSQLNNDNRVTSTQDQEYDSKWSEEIPENVLLKIFEQVCLQDGSLPNLVRLCKVCKLWRRVALTPTLWHKIDLNYVQECSRTDIQLHWLIINRLTACKDLNLGEWKIRDIQRAMEALCTYCPELKGLNLSGWNGLSADNLKYLTSECKKLERLDLSSINSTSAINSQPLVALSQSMNSRLTHLILAHNKMAGFTQIISAIATNCKNLQLLDISNIRTFAHNTALLHVEKLQVGCPKIRVLRITNSQIWLAPATLSDQVASPGFPMLEELSLAGLEEDQTTTSRSVDDEGFERILKNSTKLRLLDIRGCIRLTDSGLVKVPAWDLEHLFLSACYVTRTQNSGLELIVQKWAHSLLEVDLAWSTATAPLDAAVLALAEKEDESKLRILNLCGSSVSLEPVKAVLKKCPNLHSINLQSCRGLPRGIKRLYCGDAVRELKQSLETKPKSSNDLDNNKSPLLSSVTTTD